jgi:hypothetical protein
MRFVNKRLSDQISGIHDGACRGLLTGIRINETIPGSTMSSDGGDR